MKFFGPKTKLNALGLNRSGDLRSGLNLNQIMYHPQENIDCVAIDIKRVFIIKEQFRLIKPFTSIVVKRVIVIVDSD